MLKDTKSLGKNKAPACESRGFVLKKEGGLFDTPSFILSVMNVYLLDFLKNNIILQSTSYMNYGTNTGILYHNFSKKNKHLNK